MSVYSIIVAYKPDQHVLIKTCELLMVEDSQVIIVDNTEETYLDKKLFPVGIDIVALNYNSGIAHAQNVGIEKAQTQGAKVIIFFDQDSHIAPGGAC